eukprot:515799-Prymnesium_polylepis.1
MRVGGNSSPPHHPQTRFLRYAPSHCCRIIMRYAPTQHPLSCVKEAGEAAAVEELTRTRRRRVQRRC